MSGRTILDCSRDPAADRWTIALWCATAELLFCSHYYSEEGAYDGGGRWRRLHIRHRLAGKPANLARATAMAEHFCGVIRQASKAYERTRERSSHVRRSFESAFAERLVARLKSALAAEQQAPGGQVAYAGELAANDALLLDAGVDLPNRLGRYDVSGRDRAAVRQGRAAAENLSLVLRTAVPAAGPARTGRDQLPLPF